MGFKNDLDASVGLDDSENVRAKLYKFSDLLRKSLLALSVSLSAGLFLVGHFAKIKTVNEG